jgi:hypothetical protein
MKMPSRRKLPVWTVRYLKRYRCWCLRTPTSADYDSKEWLTGWGLKAVLAQRPPGPVSVRIYLKNGRIQSERTYPRSADPRRSKG